MRTQRNAVWMTSLLVLFAACDPSGSGSSGGSGGNGSGGGAAVSVPPRLWERTPLPLMSGNLDLATSAKGITDLVYVGYMNGMTGVYWQTLEGTPELIATDTGIYIDRPHVARDVNDSIHVVWATDGAVQYALRVGTQWTVETIASERFRPDIAVASNGTPHVAFVDEKLGDGSAYHAVRDAGGMWAIEIVNGTDYFKKSEVGIVLTKDDLPIIAAPDKENAGVWIAEADGSGSFKIEALAADQIAVGPVDLDIGDAGVAVAFKAETHAVAGFRAAGTSNWIVEPAIHHDQAELSLSVIVGKDGPLVATDVDRDLPNGFGVVERYSGGWLGQLIGPWNCGGVTMAKDAAGEPLVALQCNSQMYLMRVIGRYPADWQATCEQAAQELCKPACMCGTNGEQCCWGLNGDSTCTSSFGCPGNAVAAVCGDPTVTPEALQACRNEMPMLTCGMAGPLDLTGACGPLYQPFQ